VRYCSRQCQLQHYKAGHKKICKLAVGIKKGGNGGEVEEARRELEEAMAEVKKWKDVVAAGGAGGSIVDDYKMSSSASSSSVKSSLPDYGSAQYWNNAYTENKKYTTDKKSTYEWYGDWERTLALWKDVFGDCSEGRGVDLGCGNSMLLGQIVGNGVWKAGIGLDISPVVTDRMNSNNRAPNVRYMSCDCTSVPWSSFETVKIEDNSLDGVIDKGTLDAVLSLGGGRDGNAVEAMEKSKRMIRNALLALKPQKHMVIFSNLPQNMALPFFSEMTPHVEAIGSFEPESRRNIRLGEFVKAAEQAKTVTIYKITSDEKVNSKMTQEQKLLALEKMKEDLEKTVADKNLVKDSFASSVDEARARVEEAKKELCDKEDELSRAGAALGRSVEGMEMDDLKREVDMGIVRDIDDGFGRIIGSMSQTESDVEVRFFCARKDVKARDIDIDIQKKSLAITVLSPPNESDPEGFQFSYKCELEGTIQSSESSWCVENDGKDGVSTVSLNLVKAVGGAVWNTLHKVEQSKNDDDDDDDATTRTPIAVNISTVNVVSVKQYEHAEDFVTGKIEVHWEATEGFAFWKDYIVLCRSNVDDDVDDYLELEYAFDEEVFGEGTEVTSNNVQLTFTVERGSDCDIRYVNAKSKKFCGSSKSFRLDAKEEILGGDEIPTVSMKEGEDRFIVALERMKHIKCYQMTVVCVGEDESEEISVKIKGPNKNVFKLKSNKIPVLSVTFPQHCSISAGSIKFFDEGTDADRPYFLLRVSYASDGMVKKDDEEIFEVIAENEVPTTVEDVNSAACRFCEHELLEGGVEEVLPLPAGEWDEISDYLQCANETMYNFSSVDIGARKGLCLEDSRMLVLHHNEFRVGGLEIMAIEGYGEENEKDGEEEKRMVDKTSINFRGERKFGSGGVTLACCRCCSTLGYSSLESPETFRLYKHRLNFNSYNIGFFVAREIIKYCESQAVFVYVGECLNKNERIVMKVLSWDSKMMVKGGGEGFFPILKLLWGVEERVGKGGGG